MKIALLNYLQAKLNSICIAFFCLAVSSFNISGISDLASCIPPMQCLILYVGGCTKLSEILWSLTESQNNKLSHLSKVLFKELLGEIDSDLEVL